MPSRGKKFLTEFLLPSLSSEKFGSKLKWVDEERTKFRLQWSHRAGADWKETDAIVFTEWDKMKGHYRPKDKEYFTKSKQRFRAVLYKLICEKLISEVPSEEKGTKIYQISDREYFKVNSMLSLPTSYSYENSWVGSIASDHSYSLNDPLILESENITFYPNQNNFMCKDLTCKMVEFKPEPSDLIYSLYNEHRLELHLIGIHQLSDLDSCFETNQY